MLILSLSFVSPLLAQELPALDAQRFRPSVDARSTLWSDDAGHIVDQSFTFGALAGYTRNPLAYEDGDGEVVPVIGDLTQLDLLASGQRGRYRLGMRLPVALVSESDLYSGGGGIGDVSLDGRATLIDGPLGVALRGGVGLPTSTLGAGLASESFTWDGGLIASADVGAALLTANLGYQGLPSADVVSGEWGDQLYARLGLAVRMSEQAGVSAELAGARSLSDAGEGATGVPVEVLLGGWVRPSGPLTLRLGVGTGLTDGIGSPDLRALAGASWAFGDAPMSTVEAPVGVPVRFLVTDPDGEPVRSAQLVAAGDGISAEARATGTMLLPPGTYQLTTRADGYGDAVTELTVPAGPSWEAAVSLEPLARLGAVRVRVTGPDGAPIQATWQAAGGPPQPVEPDAEIPLEPGEHLLTIRSGDLAATRSAVTVEAGAVSELVVSLQPRLVEVTAERIVIREKVFFETSLATIKPESYALLDEVAQVLLDNPEIRRVRVEGHTDERGAEEMNLALSRDRAGAVRGHLISQGVDADRLEAEGFGEARPLVEGTGERAWAANRRVEFVITERD